MSTALEDCRITMPPSAVALRLMRQRLYGVALREYPGQSYKDILVKEWCVSGPESLRNAKEVSGIPPPGKLFLRMLEHLLLERYLPLCVINILTILKSMLLCSTFFRGKSKFIRVVGR